MSLTVQPDIFPGATLIQLREWGYPMGVLRSTPPTDKAFSVIHITANLATAERELAWRRDDPALQNSATFFVNRDGSVAQALSDPLKMAPWANGDVRSPDTSNPRIAAVVRDGVNANERTIVAIENVGNETAWGSVPGGYPITDAQIATNARIIAHYHAQAGVPVNRQTVVGHYQLNSVTRPNCPARDKSVIDRIVALAQPVLPDTAMEPDMPALTEYTGDWVTIDANANIRDESGNLLFRTARASGALRVGKVGDNSVFWIKDRNRWGFTDTAANIVAAVPLEQAFTVKVVDQAAIDSAVAALNKNLDVWVSQRPTK